MRKSGTLLSLLLLLLLGATRLEAQDAAGKKPPADSVQASMDAFAPMMQTMMTSMYTGILDFLARPETADKLATFHKNYLDALIRHGFTREEALGLVRAVGMPGLPAGR